MLRIFARRADGSVFLAFHWTRDAASGIARCWADAKVHGVEIVDAWSEG